MRWVVKLKAKTGWGEVEAIEVGKIERRVVGLTPEEIGLTLFGTITLDASRISVCSCRNGRSLEDLPRSLSMAIHPEPSVLPGVILNPCDSRA